MHILVKAQTGKTKTAIVSDSFSHHDRFFQYFTTREMQNILKKSNFEILSICQYKESDKYPSGRPEVSLILVLARKK